MTEEPRSTVFQRHQGGFGGLLAFSASVDRLEREHEEHKRDIADTKAWLDDIGHRLGAMPSARAASPSDLSRSASSCQHCIPIAGDN